MKKNQYTFSAVKHADQYTIGEKWTVKKLKTLKIVIVLIPLAQGKAFAAIASATISACDNYPPVLFLIMQNQLTIVRLSILPNL